MNISLMWDGRTGFIETLGTQFKEYMLLACKCIYKNIMTIWSILSNTILSKTNPKINVTA